MSHFFSFFFLVTYLPSSCILWAWLHFLLPGWKASVLYRSGPWSQLAPVCHGVAPLQCYDDRDVPDLWLQTPLARSANAFRWLIKEHLFFLKCPWWERYKMYLIYVIFINLANSYSRFLQDAGLSWTASEERSIESCIFINLACTVHFVQEGAECSGQFSFINNRLTIDSLQRTKVVETNAM